MKWLQNQEVKLFQKTVSVSMSFKDLNRVSHNMSIQEATKILKIQSLFQIIDNCFLKVKKYTHTGNIQ